MKKLKLKIQDLTNPGILSPRESSKITGGNEYTVWHCEYASRDEGGMVTLGDCYGEFSACLQWADTYCFANPSTCTWDWCV